MSMTAHPCEGLSKWLHELLAPALCAEFLPDFIKDTTQFITLMESARAGTHHAVWTTELASPASRPFSLDVVSMFNNIPPTLGARACATMWSRLCDARGGAHPVTP
eukprot:3912688-Alexandrium_andersonii.AAC.1